MKVHYEVYYSTALLLKYFYLKSLTFNSDISILKIQTKFDFNFI